MFINFKLFLFSAPERRRRGDGGRGDGGRGDGRGGDGRRRHGENILAED